MQFKDRLKELREEKRWSQDELADRLQITKSAVSTYERGKNHPRFAVLDQMADVFDVDINYLLGNSNQRGSYPSHDEPTDHEETEEEYRERVDKWRYNAIDALTKYSDRKKQTPRDDRSRKAAAGASSVYFAEAASPTFSKPLGVQLSPVASADLVQVVNSYKSASPEVKQAVRAILGLE